MKVLCLFIPHLPVQWEFRKGVSENSLESPQERGTKGDLFVAVGAQHAVPATTDRGSRGVPFLDSRSPSARGQAPRE